MPNWCEGTLRLKGKFANLKRFLTDGLQAVDLLGNEVDNKYRIALDEPNNFWVIAENNLHIKGSKRHFVKATDEIELYTENADEDIVLLLPIKAAWIVDYNTLVDISKTYEVHARIHSYEKGAEFEQIIDVQYGELKHYEMITHSNYQWDCDCPLIGG